MKNIISTFIQFRPVRFLSALLAFGAAIIVGLAYGFEWSGTAASLIGGGWSAFIAMVGTLFTAEQVVANPKVERLVHDTIVELSPFAPIITEAIVPVASSPLLDTTVRVKDEPAIDYPQPLSAEVDSHPGAAGVV